MKYRAFISYRRAGADRDVARWLRDVLERYSVPRAERHRNGGRRRLGRVYRDAEVAAASPSLRAEIEDALRRSDWLIVVCSPRTPESRWVDHEIRLFQAWGRAGRVLAILSEGGPTTSFPPALRSAVPDTDGTPGAEPGAADLTSSAEGTPRQRRRAAVTAIVARMLGCDPTRLARLEHARRLRRLTAATIALLLLSAVTATLGWFAIRESGRARQAEAESRAARRFAESSLGDLHRHVAMTSEDVASALLHAAESVRLRDSPESRGTLVHVHATPPTLLWAVPGTAGDMTSVAWGANGQLLVTGERAVRQSFSEGRGRLRLWDAQSGRELEAVAAGGGGVAAVSIAPSPDRVICVGISGDVTEFTLPELRQSRRLLPPGRRPLGVAVDQARRRLAVGDLDGLSVVDLHGEGSTRIRSPRRAPVSAVAFARDGLGLYVGCLDGYVGRISFDGSVSWLVQAVDDAVTTVSADASTPRLLVGSEGGAICAITEEPNPQVRFIETPGIHDTGARDDRSGSPVVAAVQRRKSARWVVGLGVPVDATLFDSAMHVERGSARGLLEVDLDLGRERIRHSLPSLYCSALEQSPDGSMLAAIGGDGGLSVLDSERGTVRARWTRVPGDIRTLSVSRSSGQVFCALATSGIAVVDAASGRRVAVLPVPQMDCMVSSRDGTVLAQAQGRYVYFFDARTGARIVDRDAPFLALPPWLHPEPAHTAEVRGLAVLHVDGQPRVLACDSRGTLSVHGARDGKLLRHAGAVGTSFVLIAPLGEGSRAIAFDAIGGRLVVIDGSTLALGPAFPLPSATVRALRTTPTGSHVLVLDEVGLATTLELIGDEFVLRGRVHLGEVEDVVLHDDGRTFVSLSANGRLARWDSTTGTAIVRWQTMIDVPRCIASGPTPGVVVVAGESGSVEAWEFRDALSGGVRLRQGGQPVASLLAAEDGRSLVTGTWGSVYEWASSGVARRWELPTDSVPMSLCRTPDGLQALLRDGSVVRLTPNGVAGDRWSCPVSKVVAAAVAAGGALLAVAGSEAGPQIVDALARTPGRELDGTLDSPCCVAWHPGGRRLWAGDHAGRVAEWDSASGKRLAIWQAHASAVRTLSVSPDGNSLVSAGDDRRVHCWACADRRLLWQGEHPLATVRVSRHSPDGRRVASGDDSGSVQITDAVGGRLLCTLPSEASPVLSIEWIASGNLLSVGRRDGVVALYALDGLNWESERSVDEAQRAVLRRLEPDGRAASTVRRVLDRSSMEDPPTGGDTTQGPSLGRYDLERIETRDDAASVRSGRTPPAGSVGSLVLHLAESGGFRLIHAGLDFPLESASDRIANSSDPQVVSPRRPRTIEIEGTWTADAEELVLSAVSRNGVRVNSDARLVLWGTWKGRQIRLWREYGVASVVLVQPAR